ncbi:phage tail P2-like protein [Kribbella sp. VKM Ac-2569]|uniref:phage tail protein n=1 Tax=Kribbella sp. VKM Ac-2569 TaxID=2512220 RepID=UPI00102BBD5E|nr:phage tail protein [Kribbella sp. VKM Ac-2569]RZT17534.1 phage tail P2-like protein [Kribbella sp. VKM Ac-2569]
MYGDRGLAVLTHEDQWARCAHRNTVLLPAGGVGLDWDEPPPPSRWDGERCLPVPPGQPSACPAGITHDRWCRTWRTRPQEGAVELIRGHAGPSGNVRPGGLRHPTGIAVDDRDRLYIVESAGRALLVVDLWSGRVLRRVPIPGQPIDVVAVGDAVLVLTRSPHAIVRVEGRTGPCAGPDLHHPCAHAAMVPARITTLVDRTVVLWRDDVTGVITDLQGGELLEAEGATDLEGTSDGMLVIARHPGQAFLRLWERGGVLVEDEPLRAPDYDGAAVTIDPSDRVVYTTAFGRRGTEGAHARHVRRGTVTTYRLDSGNYRTRWGRVFVEACLPTGTTLALRCVTSDDDDVEDPVEDIRPRRGDRPLREPEQTPPLAPSRTMGDASWLPVVTRRRNAVLDTVDPGGVSGADWTTYESGVEAPPGRYLWLEIELTGTERTSPRLRALRVERPGHSLLSALPRTWSSVDEEADFVHGFLTPAEGLVHDLDTAAAGRAVLVDPGTTPDAMLPWVASLTGLVLDRRWPEDARRRLVAEVFQLYARRGTQAALERTLTLYLGRKARIVERWRLRGLGGAVIGLGPDGLQAPTAGGNSRAAGMLGHFTVGGETPTTSSYRRFAHRFTVLVPGCLTVEQRTVTRQLLRHHQPAHTMAEICELGDGLPVGRLRVGLTAYVGPRTGRPSAVLGQARLGVGGIVGVPACGARLGDPDGSRVGRVRVG